MHGSLPKGYSRFAKRAGRVFQLYLTGRRTDAARARRLLRSDLRAAIAESPADVEHLWILLGDLYLHRDLQMHCYAQVLRLNPRNPEAHAELAYRWASSKQIDRVRRHCRRALDNAAGYRFEDDVLWLVASAAHDVGLLDIHQEAQSRRIRRRKR